MANLVQEEQLNLLANSIRQEITQIQNEQRPFHKLSSGQMQRIIDDTQMIFKAIENIPDVTTQSELYELIYRGYTACNTILNKAPTPKQIRTSVSAILELFKIILAELNIEINFHKIINKKNKVNDDKIINDNFAETVKVLEVLNDETNVHLNQTKSDNKETLLSIKNSLDELKSLKDNISNELYSRAKLHTEASKEEISKSVSNDINDIKQQLLHIESESIRSLNLVSNEKIKVLKDIHSHSITDFNKGVQDKISTIENSIDTEIGKFESKRIDMDKLLEKVGLAKDADVTITQADKEETMANKLRFYGLGLMYGSIALLVIFFAEYIGLNFWSTSSKSLSDLTLNDFIIRFMTVLLVSSPAVYLLKESAYHRNKENLYRQRGTQLLTIRGYLADLQPEERTKVKQDLAKNFFSFHDGKTDTQNVPDFVRDMKEAVSIAKSINSPTPKRKSTILGKGSK